MTEIKVSQRAREAANNWIRTAPLAVKMAVVNPTLLYEAFARFEQAIRADERERAAKVAESLAAATNEDGVRLYKTHVCLGAEMAADALRARRNDGADGRVQELNKISGAQP